MAELAPSEPNRPFVVIDDGWSPTNTAGPWERGNAGFPDMPGLAAAMNVGCPAGYLDSAPVHHRRGPPTARLRPRAGARDATLDPSCPRRSKRSERISAACCVGL